LGSYLVELGSTKARTCRELSFIRFWDPHPFVRLVRISQSEVVIDGLGGKDGRKALREWLQTVERAVAAHTNQAFDTLVH
jgi:hypothetical protein